MPVDGRSSAEGEVSEACTVERVVVYCLHCMGSARSRQKSCRTSLGVRLFGASAPRTYRQLKWCIKCSTRFIHVFLQLHLWCTRLDSSAYRTCHSYASYLP
jgi:hypothetical protein